MHHKFSILIITYNRSADLSELLTEIVQLEKKDELLLEVILINNHSSEDYSAVENMISRHKEISIRYIVADKNLGVAGGRNKAMQLAQGSLLLLVDDDVLLPDKGLLVKIDSFFKSQFAQKNNVGILTPLIRYHSTGAVQENAFPHKKFKKYSAQQQFLTSYFIGAAHVIKKEVLKDTGLLPDNFFYGMEEYDLSFRAIKAGYTLAFDNSVTILHKESPQGRIPEKKKLQMMWINKSSVMYRYLPSLYFVTTAVLWSLRYFRKYFFKGYFSTWKKILKIPSATPRDPLHKDHFQYLKKTEARLWY